MRIPTTSYFASTQHSCHQCLSFRMSHFYYWEHDHLDHIRNPAVVKFAKHHETYDHSCLLLLNVKHKLKKNPQKQKKEKLIQEKNNLLHAKKCYKVQSNGLLLLFNMLQHRKFKKKKKSFFERKGLLTTHYYFYKH